MTIEQIGDLGSLDTLLDSLGSPAPAADPKPTPEPPVSETPPAEPQPDITPPAEGAPPDPPKEDPKNRAFAEQRAQIAQFNKVFKELAQKAGLPQDATPEQVLAHLEQKQAEKKVDENSSDPSKLAEVVAQQERVLQTLMQERHQNELASVFKGVADTFGATPDEMYTFAEQLYNTGIDPIASREALPLLYKGMQHDKIVAAKVDQAVRDALTKDSRASEHSTVPTLKTGGAPADAGDKIASMADLNSFLDGVK